jgi:hypothetical protein
MRDIIFLLFDLLTTLAKLLRPGGRSIVAGYFNYQWQLEIAIRQGQAYADLEQIKNANGHNFASLFLQREQETSATLVVDAMGALSYYF